MKRTCGGRTTPQAMGRYIMRTGSTGLGSILFTSPRITGHRHRSVRSPSPAADPALEVFRNAASPLQHSLCGVGVSDSLPVRNVPQVISPASGVTQSVGDDGVEPTLPGRPGKPGSAASGALGQGGCDTGVDGTPGVGAGDGLVPGKPDAGGDGLAPGKPGKMGLRGLVPGRPGNRRSTSASEATA